MSDMHTLPRWIQDLRRYQALKSLFYLHGNIYDCYFFPVNYNSVSTESDLLFAKYNDIRELLQQYLFLQGFEVITYFDVIDGLRVDSTTKDVSLDNLLLKLNLTDKRSEQYFNDSVAKKLDGALGLYRDIMGNSALLSAGIINFASRITSSPNSLEEDAKPMFLKMIKAAQESRVFQSKGGLRNILLFLCDKLNDIPAWVMLENPLTQGIEITRPDRRERMRFFQQRNSQFYLEGQEPKRNELERIFPDLTDKFSFRELENLISISRQEKIHLNNLKEIIDLYKYGIKDNPWEKIDPIKIENAEDELGKRVMGQEKAVKKAVEIIRRSNLALDSIDKTKPSNKPKGVLFFAGPTGTGKTELAKALAELVFSDEEAMIRFDMSEFNDSNSDVKFIGSPPGYVGYDEGGQLTDAIREKPFSIVLFDEIEKAHPKIFDKFLQILDDGRLTDGKGETVYFSQTLIVFTSNLGFFKEDELGRRVVNVSYGEPYDLIDQKIQLEIKNYFGKVLGRPEIFNRFGDNFVVFDFIRPTVALKIAEKNIGIIRDNLKKIRNIELVYDELFIEEFMENCANDNLEMGGRGIVNRIETHIKNGLTNHIFHSKKLKDARITMNFNGNKIEFT